MAFFRKGFGSGVSTLVIVVVWGISMFLIYNKNYATVKTGELTDVPMDAAVSGEFQNWMNVNMAGSKIGYAMQSFSNTPLGYVLKDYSLIRLPMGGTVREIYLDSYAVLSVDYSLKNFTFGLISGDYTTDVFGEVSDGKLKIKLKSRNSETEAAFDASRGIYLPSVIPLLAHARAFPEGEFSLTTFDPFSLALSDMQVVIGAREKIGAALGESEGYRISLVMSGIESRMWVDSSGHVLREEEAGNMMMLATSKDDALNIPAMQTHGQDVLTQLAVSCDGTIPDPRNLVSLKVRIDGIKPGAFDLQDDFQTVTSENPLEVEIHPQAIAATPLENPMSYLGEEPLLQVNDPKIADAAARITAGAVNAADKVDKIAQWVFENIKKDYSVSLPSAVDVLQVRRGDCNEHTVLFTALARSAGIPTKICIGIVYKDGLFFYHAWPAVYLNGWRSIDPTLGQGIADATHIKLLEGGLERQADLMRAVGKISVTVISYPKGEKL